MTLWTILEGLAWVGSAIFGGVILYDWFRTDTTYSEAELTSSREGELEALNEERG